MKKITQITLLLSIYITLSACAGTPVFNDPAPNSTAPADIQYQKVASTFRKYLPTAQKVFSKAIQLILRRAVDAQDVKDKASLVSGSILIFRQMTANSILSGDEFSNRLDQYFPDKSHWKDYADGVTLIFSLLQSMAGGYSSLVLEGLSALADTGDQVLAQYL